jgi:hypothetical protein
MKFFSSPSRLVTGYGYLIVGLLVLLVYQLFLLHPVGTGYERIIADRDAYLHTWNLWWVNEAVFIKGTSPYFTTYNGFPGGLSLTFNQMLLPLGLMSGPLFWLGFTAGQILLFWQYVFGIVGYFGMYCLVKQFDGSSLGATVAGLHFVLLPIYWRNLPTPDSLCYVLFPLVVLSVYWSDRGSLYRQALPVLLGSIILLMSPYFGAGLGLLWLLALLSHNHLDLHWKRLLTLAPLVLLVTAFHWVRQLLGEPPNVPSMTIIEAFSADLSAWFLPPAQMWWIPSNGAWWVDTWKVPEGSMYMGWFALAILLVGVVDSGWYKNRFPLLVAIVFFIIALGPALTVVGTTFFWGLPYQWGLEILPFLKAFRAPVRFGFFVLFFFSLGLGVYFPERGKLSLLVGALILLELIRVPVSTNKLPSYESLEKVRQTVSDPGLVPVPLTGWPSEVQYAQTIHRKKLTLLGISFTPKSALRLISSNPVLDAIYNRRDLPTNGWDQLRRMNYGGVIIHHQLYEGQYLSRRRQWIAGLTGRFGPPEIRSDRFMLFLFDE